MQQPLIPEPDIPILPSPYDLNLPDQLALLGSNKSYHNQKETHATASPNENQKFHPCLISNFRIGNT